MLNCLTWKEHLQLVVMNIYVGLAWLPWLLSQGRPLVGATNVSRACKGIGKILRLWSPRQRSSPFLHRLFSTKEGRKNWRSAEPRHHQESSQGGRLFRVRDGG